jgi:hypothetical protein
MRTSLLNAAMPPFTNKYCKLQICNLQFAIFFTKLTPQSAIAAAISMVLGLSLSENAEAV